MSGIDKDKWDRVSERILYRAKRYPVI